MSKFCTACGAKNEDDATFCDNCGKPMRAAVQRPIPTNESAPLQPVSKPQTESPAPLTTRVSGRTIGLAVAAIAVIAVAGGGAAWWFKPPEPSNAAFTAALKAAANPASKPATERLCIANGIPYGQSQINVSGFNGSTRNWMDALVAAGLYEAGEESVSTSGIMPETSIRYVAKPELAQWVRDNRLCVGKAWTATGVQGDTFPKKSFGSRVVHSAVAVWTVADLAPWLAKSPRIAEELRGTKLDGENLSIETRQAFELQDRKWIALTKEDGPALMRLDQMREEFVRNAETGHSDREVPIHGVIDGLIQWVLEILQLVK